MPISIINIYVMGILKSICWSDSYDLDEQSPEKSLFCRLTFHHFTLKIAFYFYCQNVSQQE